MRSPCHPPAEGIRLSAPVLLIDNSRFLASNIRLYRSVFFAFIGEPEVLGPEDLRDLRATSYTHGRTVVDQTRKADQYHHSYNRSEAVLRYMRSALSKCETSSTTLAFFNSFSIV
jgi:hypothetical protein